MTLKAKNDFRNHNDNDRRNTALILIGVGLLALFGLDFLGAILGTTFGLLGALIGGVFGIIGGLIGVIAGAFGLAIGTVAGVIGLLVGALVVAWPLLLIAFGLRMIYRARQQE